MVVAPSTAPGRERIAVVWLGRRRRSAVRQWEGSGDGSPELLNVWTPVCSPSPQPLYMNLGAPGTNLGASCQVSV